ncbi:MAG: diguanylate cyclase [Pseudomonadota bacterium]
MKQTPLSGNKLSIAFLTSRPQDATTITRTLEHVFPGVTVRAVADEARLELKPASILIVDTEMVSGAGLEHILDKAPETPAIIVVGDFSQVRHFSHMLSGRRTIVTRGDLTGMGLVQALHHLLERHRLHEQLKRTAHHLKEISIRDDLTHLINHRHLDEMLSSEVKKANRYKRPLGLVIVAIKNFTAINESLGHEEGDRILAKAADMIRGVVREVDVPSRYGDNEFAVILPESDETAAAIVARRIQDALASIVTAAPELGIQILTSTGIASLSHKIQTKDEIIRTALGALIEAKRSQSSTIKTWGEIDGRRRDVHENRQLIDQLHERLARLSFEAERGYFQSLLKAIGEIPLVKKVLMPHSERVAFYAQRLAESLGLGEAEERAIHRAGILHDAGKLAIGADILGKAGGLSLEERELVKQHPLFAVQIIGQTPFFTAEPAAILHHHERYDGSGYPDGIAGNSIPLSARILAIAEAWDTMITPQPYRAEPLPLDRALAELKAGAGGQFDAELVERFTGLIAG